MIKRRFSEVPNGTCIAFSPVRATAVKVGADSVTRLHAKKTSMRKVSPNAWVYPQPCLLLGRRRRRAIKKGK